MDCNDCKITWASVNHGILLCLECALAHKKNLPTLSVVKSLDMPYWEDKEIEFLKLGGNARFKRLLEKYNFTGDHSDTLIKYRLKAADYYRKLLASEVTGSKVPDKLGSAYGLMFVSEQKECKPQKHDVKPYGESDDARRQNDEIILMEVAQASKDLKVEDQPGQKAGFFSKFGMYLDSGVKKFEENSKKFKDNMNKAGKEIKDSNMYKKITETTNELVDKAKKKFHQIYDKEISKEESARLESMSEEEIRQEIEKMDKENKDEEDEFFESMIFSKSRENSKAAKSQPKSQVKSSYSKIN